jgi:acyl carrier protein
MTTLTELDDAALLEVVTQSVAAVLELPKGAPRPEHRLVDDLHADSLALIEIVEVSEERLGALGRCVRVDDATLARLATLADVVTVLRAGLER